MTLQEKYHPKKLSDLYGQVLAQKILTGILKHPQESPRVLIFHGEQGIGKTSATQVFAQSLNCLAPSSAGNPCGRCENCVSIERAPYYRDLDCGLVGNVDNIRKIQEDLKYGISVAKWQVVVFDEFHMASKTSQQSLLKVLDSFDSKTFVIFVTTELDGVVHTIQSRAVPVPFNTIPDSKALNYIDRIASKENLEISDRVKERIVLRAQGHIRDLMKELGVVKVVGESVFKDFVDYEKLIIQLLIMIRVGDKDKFDTVLNSLCLNPMFYIQSYFYRVLDRAMQHIFLPKTDYIHSDGYEHLKKLWRMDLVELFKFCVSDWGSKSFENEYLFRCFMHSTYLKFDKKRG